MLYTQVSKGAALIDAEQQLVRVGCLALLLQTGHLSLAALEPAGGALTAGFGVRVLGRILHTLIKGHCNGGTQVCLDLHTLLRAHKDAVAVQMGSKGHAFFRDLTQLGQAEHLESAAVGQDGAVPAGKLVQAAHIGYQLITGAQMQVVGVAEHYLGADLLQILRGQAALDGTGGGNILEGRGLHRAVHGLELTPPGVVLLLEQLKSGQRRHKFFPFCVRKTAVQPCAAGQAAGSEVVDTELPKRFRQCFGLLGERVLRDHRISIASPKEKKRYFSSTATL